MNNGIKKKFVLDLFLHITTVKLFMTYQTSPVRDSLDNFNFHLPNLKCFCWVHFFPEILTLKPSKEIECHLNSMAVS